MHPFIVYSYLSPLPPTPSFLLSIFLLPLSIVKALTQWLLLRIFFYSKSGTSHQKESTNHSFQNLNFKILTSFLTVLIHCESSIHAVSVMVCSEGVRKTPPFSEHFAKNSRTTSKQPSRKPCYHWLCRVL
ncbi:hypothetical protein SAMN04488089_11094 [Myroides profundi]|uniref:Uncharacterized protein n=1 Tax=Myroides profundi TaxID=480520 RepID=A0AAJ4W536_MYRPR|nr:hypothetical protein SAMN04488089_11094 [Myroides profundi]